MENENKLVKVYSNNSKKARLKRNKNKFQRIWDAEKQTYVKVRKAKYPAHTVKCKKDWREEDNSVALKRRSETPKKPKSVPVSTAQKTIKPAVVHKPETKQHAEVHTKTESAKIVKIHGVNYTWDTKALRYKKAA